MQQERVSQGQSLLSVGLARKNSVTPISMT